MDLNMVLENIKKELNRLKTFEKYMNGERKTSSLSTSEIEENYTYITNILGQLILKFPDKDKEIINNFKENDEKLEEIISKTDEQIVDFYSHFGDITKISSFFYKTLLNRIKIKKLEESDSDEKNFVYFINNGLANYVSVLNTKQGLFYSHGPLNLREEKDIDISAEKKKYHNSAFYFVKVSKFIDIKDIEEKLKYKIITGDDTELEVLGMLDGDSQVLINTEYEPDISSKPPRMMYT